MCCAALSHSVMSDSLRPTRLLCPWGFSRQEYWSGLPCPLGDLPNPGIEPTSLMSPPLAGGFLTTRATWEAQSPNDLDLNPSSSTCRAGYSTSLSLSFLICKMGLIISQPCGAVVKIFWDVRRLATLNIKFLTYSGDSMSGFYYYFPCVYFLGQWYGTIIYIDM